MERLELSRIELERVMRVVSLFFIGELVKRVDGLAVVEFAVIHVLGRAHDGDIQLTVTGADMIPVDEIDVCELAAIQNAVLDSHGLAAAEEDRAQMAVGVHAGVIARLIDVAAELRVDGAGVAVLMLLGKVGDHLAHDVEQVMLQVFQIERVDVVGALLDHDGAGGVVGRDADRAVLDAGFLDDLNDLTGDIVEGGDPAAGLQLEFFLINLEFHCV